MFKAAFEQSTKLGDYLKNSAESDITKYNKAVEEMSGTLGELDLSLVTSNDAMRGYLGTIESGAIPSMEGFKTYCKENGLALKEMTLAQNAAAIGAKALSVAMNALIGIGISMAISATVKAFDDYIHAAEKTKERAEALIETYNSTLETANKNAKTTEELTATYEKLSKGVDNLGKNVSLTNEEYTEYNNTVNKIAEMFPTLVQGYTNEGTAILSLKGNVNQLRDAYKEAQQEAYKLLIVDGKDQDGNDILEDWKNDSSIKYTTDSGASAEIERSKAIEQLQALSNMEYERWSEIEQLRLDNLTGLHQDEFNQLSNIEKQLMDSKGYIYQELDFSAGISKEDFANIQKTASVIAQEYETQLQGNLKNVELMSNAFLVTNKDYDKLNEEAQNVASILVNNLDEDIAKGFENKNGEMDKDLIGTYVENIVDLIKNNPILSKSLIELFNLDSSKLSTNEFKEQVDSLIDNISKIIGEDSNSLKLRLGFDFSDLEPQINRVKEYLYDQYREQVGTLTQEDLKIASELEIPQNTLLSWEELLQRIKEVKGESKKAETPLLSFKKAWADLDDNDESKEAKENLLALAEAGQLTVDAFKDSSIATDFMKATGLSAEQATQKINKLIEDVKQLNAMRTGITAITSAYDEKKDSKQKTVSASTLDSMATTLGIGDWDKKDKKVWQEYKDTAGNSAASLRDLKSAQDKLATSYVNSNNFLANLNDTNKDYYRSLLDEMGVTNSAIVVEDKLRQKKADSVVETWNEIKAEKKKVQQIDKVKDALKNCTKKEQEYYYAKLLANEENIDTKEECEALRRLGEELRLDSTLINSLRDRIISFDGTVVTATVNIVTNTVTGESGARATSNSIKGSHTNYTGDKQHGGSNDMNYNASAYKNSKTMSKTAAIAKANQIKNDVKVGVQTSKGNKTNNSSGSSNKSGGSGSGSGNKTTWSTWGTEIDWIAKKIDVLNNKISLLDATYQNLPVNSINQIEKANKTLSGEIKTYDKLISTYGTAEKKYNKKAEQILKKGRKVKETSGESKKKKTRTVTKGKLTKKQIAEIKKRVSEGKLNSKTSLNQLIKTYGSEQAETIQQYLNYLDQANSAAQNKQSAIASRREKQIQKKQNYADYYQSQSDLADLRASDTSDTVKNRNKYLDNEIDFQKKYYENLIAIAKLEKDNTEQARLQEEWQQKKIELQKQQLQNLVDEQNAFATLYSTQAGQQSNYSSTASGTYKNQNKFIEQQKKALQKSYEYQIKIAKLDNDETEQNRLKLELEKQLVDLTQQEIDNIKTAYQNRIGYIDNANSDLDNAINLLSARGATVGSAYYNGKSTANNAQLKLIREERSALQSQLANLMPYSDEWYSLQEEIQSLDDTESNLLIANVDNNTAVRELADKISEAIIAMDDNIKSEGEFVAGLLGNKESFEKASITNEGLAKLGTYGFSAEADEASINQIRKDRNAVQNAKVGQKVRVNGIDITFDSQEQIKESLNELIKQEQEYTSALYDDYQGIIDFMKDYYQAQLDYMKELIDAKKSLIEEEKEQYEYEKTIAEKTKNIATLQKQLAALQGDNSEEGRARRSALQVSLDEANQDLQDTEYDKYLSNQEQMLDNLYSEYESMLNVLLKDTDALLQQGIDLMNDNIPAITAVLGDTSDNWGYDYSENFDKIMSALTGAGSEGNILTKIGDVASIVEEVIKETNNEAVEEQKKTEKEAEKKTEEILTKNDITPTKTTSNSSTTQNTTTGAGMTKTEVKDYAETAAKIAATSVSTGGSGLNWKEAKIYADEAAKVASTTTSTAGGSGLNKTEAKVYADEAAKVASSQLTSAKTFISTNAKKASKKKSEYSYVNQKIYAATSGKVLTTDNLKKLAKNLGVTYNNAKETGNLAKKLKAIKYPGFQIGGIIRANGVPLNGDNIPVRVNPNETILTQKFTDILPQTVEKMDAFNKLVTLDPNKYSSVSSGNTIGDIVINADMSGVQDPYDFVHELQTNQKVQKAVTVAVNDLMTKGKITKNVQKVR